MRFAILAATAAAFLAGPAAFAANANHPYQNCDKRVDNCGPTGDNATDRLNEQQLGQSPTMAAPGQDTGMSQPMPAAPMAPRQ